MRTRARNNRGSTLVVTLITMAVVGVLVDLALQYTGNIGRNVQRSIRLRQAINIGDASTEMSFSAWRAICRQNQTKIYKRSDMDQVSEIPTPTPGNFPGVDTYNLSNCKVYPLDSYWNIETSGSSTPAPIAGPNHGDLSYYYLASADVIIPTATSKTASSLGSTAAKEDTGNVVAKIRRVFQKEVLSLWRYAIFFDGDMEIHPGPAMNVTGDVHTNGSLYTGHSSLTLSGKTTYTDDWSIGFMSGDSTHPETPTSPNWATGLPPAADQEQQPYGVHLDDYHPLIDYTTAATDLDPYRFQSQAGVVVTVDASNNIKIYNSTGKDITNKTGGSADAKTAAALKAALTTDDAITDNREGATTGNGSIRLTTLDVSSLKTPIENGDLGVNWNGVIYIVDTSASSDGISAKRGIRLKNGGKLPDGGMTVASANPVYIEGDFNTGSVASTTPGATPSVQPASNTGDPTKPTVSGYNRQPAAVVADAVNILSNSWKDSTSASLTTAAPTTINAAIVSGNVPTGNGYYSGGVENFPRFLENWAGKNFTYYGSMIQLYKSNQAIGRWGSPNVYSAPNRAWYFDTNFVTNPPPGLLASFNYRRSRWYMEN